MPTSRSDLFAWLDERADALDREQAWLIAHSTDPIDCAARDALLAPAQRRAGGEPIAYGAEQRFR